MSAKRVSVTLNPGKKLISWLKTLAVGKCSDWSWVGEVIRFICTLIAICVLAYFAKEFALSLNGRGRKSVGAIEVHGTNINITSNGNMITNIYHFSSQIK